MSLTSQFSLSVELTKLIPLAVGAAGKSYDAAVKFAREVQGSGSNIILEENLLAIFGRLLIDERLSSSFRTIVSKSKHNGVHQLSEQMGLYWGPGPSVSRAFNDKAYMAMLIQCSLLASVHQRKSLADNIAKIYEKRAETAPTSHSTDPFPRVEDIEAYLRVCDDQTAEYDWSLLLLAVASKLGLAESAIYQTLPSVILCSLPDMAPWVQRWPENYMITIEVASGVCMLVAWVHFVLGIPVLVKMHLKSGLENEVFFGETSELLVIEFYEKGIRSTVTLLSHSEPGAETNTLTLKADPDDDEVRADPHTPVRGYGRKVLENITSPIKMEAIGMKKRLLSEFASLTLAFSLLISCHISIIAGGTSQAPRTPSEESPTESLEAEYTAPLPDRSTWTDYEDTYHKIPVTRIFAAANILFDGEVWTKGQTDDYKNFYYGQRLTWIKDPPDQIKTLLQGESDSHLWQLLKHSALWLSELALAFAHVQELDDYGLLPIGLFRGPLSTELGDQVYTWQGEGPIRVNGDVWFQSIADAMMGTSGSENFTLSSVVSERGWSVFYNTFGEPDSCLAEPGMLAIRRGVPWNRGIWKHRVVDAPVPSVMRNFDHTPLGPGNLIQLRCLVPMRFGPLLCGQNGDCFVVSRKIYMSDTAAIRVESQILDTTEKVVVTRVGYRELYLASLLSKNTDPCQHGDSSTDKTLLRTGCIALAGIGTPVTNKDLDELLMIFLTAKDKVARWAALVACYRAKEIEQNQFVMVRSNHCCLQCAIDQARADATVRKLIL